MASICHLQLLSEPCQRGLLMRMLASQVFGLAPGAWPRKRHSHLDRCLARSTIRGTAGGLQGNRDRLRRQERVDLLHPCENTRWKLLRVQTGKDPAKGIMGGNAHP